MSDEDEVAYEGAVQLYMFETVYRYLLLSAVYTAVTSYLTSGFCRGGSRQVRPYKR